MYQYCRAHGVKNNYNFTCLCCNYKIYNLNDLIDKLKKNKKYWSSITFNSELEDKHIIIYYKRVYNHIDYDDTIEEWIEFIELLSTAEKDTVLYEDDDIANALIINDRNANINARKIRGSIKKNIHIYCISSGLCKYYNSYFWITRDKTYSLCALCHGIVE